MCYNHFWDFTTETFFCQGHFDKISGDIQLKDNVITLLKIKSQAPQLATYIVGYYNLEKIYSKFKKS